MTYGEVKPYSLTQVSITDPHCVTERQDHRGSDGGGGAERGGRCTGADGRNSACNVTCRTTATSVRLYAPPDYETAEQLPLFPDETQTVIQYLSINSLYWPNNGRHQYKKCNRKD